ncbi:14546_t:CDS:10 [Cetraspora pellucida]|uniref:14546_t:CDS:1 n=1 Tax=Cetraspora pellucida TaxID=1433469 RepID=A0A9N9EF11_9GLOM|nr:14546_t:CDS:10 [Cetraspora pellucida]
MSKQSAQVIRYGGGESDDYSISNTPTLPKVEEQVSNTTSSTEQQERFDDKFTQKDVMNKIYYLLPNYGAKEGISLLDAYTREELTNRLIIQIDQKDKQAPKFSVIDDISKIYGLPGIHECINGQWLLRPVIDINASKERIEAENINTKNVFFSICCSFVRALYRILDCSWKEIIKELVIMTLSDDNKCSYYLLYTPALLVDYLELKEFTELVFRLTGEKYKKFIDRGLPGRNFCLRLIGSAKKDRMKRILQFSLDNDVEKINQKKIIVGQDSLKKYANLVLQEYSDYLGGWDIEEKNSQKNQQKNKNNVPPPISHKIKGPKFSKPFLEMLGWVKYNEPLTVSERYKERYVKPLSKENDIYIGSRWGTGKTYAIENLNIPENTSLLIASTRHTYLDAITSRLNLKSYCDIDGPINLREHQRVVYHASHKCPPNPYILVLDEILLIILQTQTCLSGLSISLANFSELITQAERDFDQIGNIQLSTTHTSSKKKKNIQDIVRALRADFLELRIKEYHGVSCINPKFERAFCIFSSYIETNAGTNQMLFHMRCIKDYICYIQQRASKAPTTEEGLFQWLTEAKCGCLPQELQNRGIFPNIDTIIRNKDVPTIRLWVAYMMEKFRSQHLFGWRMVDFLRKAGMVVSVIEPTPKPEDNTMLLTETVKECSSVIKAEEISDLANANIINRETAEHLENKPKKTLEEMRALDWHYIVNCYNIAPESLTKEFISENDRLATVTRAEKHRICLGLLKICTLVKDIDDRNKYKTDIVKTRLESPESIKYFQELVPKMACLKLKGTNNKHTHYHLVGAFNSIYAYAYTPELPLYQTGEDWDNREDWRYGYNKLSPDEIETSPNSISQNTQNLFDIC